MGRITMYELCAQLDRYRHARITQCQDAPANPVTRFQHAHPTTRSP
jgi:hypothetical protein